MRIVIALRRLLLAIDPREVTFEQRRFHAARAEARRHLEGIGLAFLSGYDAALESRGSRELAERLDGIDAFCRGFAYEGAAMACGMLDALTPGTASRWRSLHDAAGDRFGYLLHVGLGWCLARLPRLMARRCRAADPLLYPLLTDGWGFHDGYFRSSLPSPPRRLDALQRRFYDQGLGRSLWFREAGQSVRIRERIADCDALRHADLWSGVGLAACYASGGELADLVALREHAGEHCSALAQGAAFAAAARSRGANRTPACDLAVLAITGLEAGAAAGLVTETLAGLPPDQDQCQRYHHWRLQVQQRLPLHRAA